MAYLRNKLVRFLSEGNTERGDPDSNNYVVKFMTSKDIIKYNFCSKYVKNKVVLNAACGKGYGGDILLKGRPKRIINLDIDPLCIQYAKKHYLDHRLIYEVGDVCKLRFKKYYFDTVISIETIEHLRQPEAFIKEIKRVLKKGGLLILSTPNKKVSSKLFNNPYHPSEFTTKDLIALLSKYFTIQEHYLQEPFIKRPKWLAYLSGAIRFLFGKPIIVKSAQNLVGISNIFICKN
jgi:ubiquinone/menaquinone biosynthesis C-methylase UbiE